MTREYLGVEKFRAKQLQEKTRLRAVKGKVQSISGDQRRNRGGLEGRTRYKGGGADGKRIV